MKQGYSIVFMALALAGCGGGYGPGSSGGTGYSSSSSSASSSSSSVSSSSSSSSAVALKSLAAQLGTHIGVAVPAGSASNSIFTVTAPQVTINTHFDSIVAENIMKMSYLEPTQGTFFFADADESRKYGGGTFADQFNFGYCFGDVLAITPPPKQTSPS